MSALRKAGVWLGLVEEEDERPEIPFDDEFDDADDEDFAPPARPRSLARPAQRTADREPRVDHREPRADHRDSRSDQRGRGGRDHGTGEYRETRSRLAAERPDPGPEPRPQPRTDARADSRLGDRADSRAADRDEPDYDVRTPDWSGRGEEPSASRGVRQLTRSTPPPTPSTTVSYPTQDNLALAPQVHLRERGVVADEKNRRYQITTLHPTNYSEARTIGEHFRAGYPVIINLTELDQADAKRLVDFAAGLAFGLHGSMERVTNRVFLLSPPNIQVSAEDKAKIAEGGFFDHD